jgi:MFS family permease
MMLCWLTCLITTSALFPSYLLDFLRLTPPQMGVVMSAIGIGAAAGTLLLPALSDWTGRKPIMLAATLGTALSLLCLAHLGPAPAWLFAALFCVHFCNNALITLTVGPICVESVPPALMTTAAGLVIATGEFFGGGIAPVLGGQIAQHFGIRHLLALPIATSLAGLALCATLPEPNAESETAHGHA